MPARIRTLLLVCALIAVACGLRWNGLDRKVWNVDEGSTFTMAEIVRSGGVIYRDAVDPRTPLVPYIKAGIFAVVGDWNIRGVHLTLAIMVGLTAVWLWRLGHEAKDEATGLVGAICFTFLSFVLLDPVDAMAAHTGWFLIFFSTLGMWAFFAALVRESGKLALLAGTAFALAALAKQPGLLDWGVCLVVCGLDAWITPARRRPAARLALMLTLGLAWPLLATAGYFASHEAWDDFLRYAWFYNLRYYVPAVPLHERLLGILVPFRLARESAPIVFGLGLTGAAWLLGRVSASLGRCPKEFPVLPWLILGWSASGLCSTILSGRNFDHYSIQVLPGLSLACGWVTVRIWENTAAWHGVARAGAWLLRTALGAGLLSLPWAAVRRAQSLEVADGISREIGLVIKARTGPEDRIFVWGYEPELNVFSERLPSTRFVYSVFLTGLIPWTNLDPQKNTDYAIVPGAWDAFWTDFAQHPPAMIADTRANRGFLKYPLPRQTRLWETIERDYAEVAGDFAHERGYALYQRTRMPPPADLSALPVDSRFSVAAPDRCQPDTLRVHVDAPAGATAVDLYLDGRPFRRVENPDGPAGPIVFFVPQTDLALGSHTLQALARGKLTVASPARTVIVEATPPADRRFAGPILTFAGQNFTPVESATFAGDPLTEQADGRWNAHAPSRLAYLRPAGLTHVDFTFGLTPGSYDGSHSQKSDGVDIVVYFEEENGRQTQVYRRSLDPVNEPADRVLQSGRAALPGRAGGKIIFLITAGPMNNPAFDWAYWRTLTGDTPDHAVSFRGQAVPLRAADGKSALPLAGFRQRDGQFVPATAQFSFHQLPGMVDLSGDFGILDDGRADPQASEGMLFEVEQVLPNGTRRTLFNRTLRPATKENDRGVQSFHVALAAYAEGAQIHLRTQAAKPGSGAPAQAFWYGLVLHDFSAQLVFSGGEINSLNTEAINGMNYVGEDGIRVLFAHAPSQITFALQPAARRLTGEIGLLRAAYTGENPTDGAVFVVEVESKEGILRELFRRQLNPRDVPVERGSIPFSVDLPSLPDAKIILRTLSAPSGNLNRAWSYWGKLELKR